MAPRKTDLSDLAEAAAQFNSEKPSSADGKTIRIVAIGASAGGLEPLELFFRSIPDDTGFAFVVIQHLSPDFKSLMNELLARHTDMPSQRVTDGMPVEPNTIYLIPPHMEMEVEGGRLRLKERAGKEALSLPIDTFLHSLADELGKDAIAVILSGAGNDGTRGAQTIIERGGLVIVQDPESAKFDGMPRNVIKAEAASAIRVPSAIPDLIRRHVDGNGPGKPDHVHIRFEPSEDPDEMSNLLHSTGIGTTLVDVSEHLRAQSDLQKSEERYRSIYNDSPVMQHSIDSHGRIVRVSDFWLKSLGYQRDQVIGRPAIDFLAPASRKSALERSIAGLLCIGACDREPVCLQKKDGGTIDVLLSAIEARDAAVGDEQSLAVLIDVTEHNRAVRELSHNREQLTLALKALHGGYFSVDCATGTFETSFELAMLVGRGPDETLSLADWTGSIHDDDKAKADLTLLMAGDVDQDSTLLRLKDPGGHWLWVDCQRRLVRNEQGKPERVIGMLVDVTDLKEAEDHANRQTQTVTIANEELERFAHIVAHDLRSPLRGVKNLCKFLKSDLKDKIDARSEQHLTMLNSQVEKMSRMLNDLLDYALLHADAGQIEKVDVKTLVEDAAGLVLQRDGFKLEIDGTFPVMHADPTPLSLVFRNLIDNAVKHHDKDQGAIRVTASSEDGFVRFSICDDGPGIPEKFRAVIFDFFKSLSPHPTHEGAGMGLTFVKKVIAKHGGEVTVAGNPGGHGSCFTFTWPLADKDKIKTVAGPKRRARKTAARKLARRCD